MEERKLDPSLSRTIAAEKKASECWWLRSSVDLATTKELDFASWVSKQDDLPSLDTLLQVTEHARQRWIILNASPRWSEYQLDKDSGTPYRDTWMHLRGYLLPKSQMKKAIKALDERNYFGGWLPEGGKSLHVFAGEYPWATACNTEPDWYLGGGEKKVSGSDLRLLHSSNEVVAEWEYDATLPSSIYLEVPTKKFFSRGDLWWNGVDGFATAGGKTAFFDPRIQHGGPPALLADLDDLLVRLDRIGCRLVWTLLGEKWILGDSVHVTPRICYSQLAWLEKDGSVKTGKRVFFDDYDRDQGLNKV